MANYCKIRKPKRNYTEWIVSGIGLTAGLITIAGKMGFMTTTLSTTPIAFNSQDYLMLGLGSLVLILIILLWRRTR